jgi:hypothetical protein
MTFRDKYGILHHRKVKDGNPETSENGPLFDGTYIALSYYANTLYANDCWEYVKRTEMYSSSWETKWGITTRAVWNTVPGNDHDRFSRDNWSGVFAGLECCERKAKKWKDRDLQKHIALIRQRCPLLHKQLDHPRDFLLAIGFKYKLLRPFTMWASKLAAVISMWQTHKHKGQLAKTDGKIIGLALSIAFDWRWTQWVMTKLLKRKRIYPMPNYAWHLCTKHKGMRWSWDSWQNIFLDYFRTMEHPSVIIAGELDKEKIR